MPLSGQKAVITGAGRGIGRVIALTLAKAGADVALAARTDRELNAVAREVEALGRQVLVVPTDISREEDVRQLGERVIQTWGTPDILVNNAAAFAGGPVATLPVRDWDLVLSTNLRGTFLVTQAFLPGMLKQKSGSIVMISSTSGKRADAGGAAYSASKFGLMGLAQALLYEVRKSDLRVIVISPSAVDTARTLRGRHLHAQDVADMVLAAVQLPQRCLVREIELWGTNP